MGLIRAAFSSGSSVWAGSTRGRWAIVSAVGLGVAVLVALTFRVGAGASQQQTCSGPTGTAYVAEAGYDAFGAVDTSDCQVLATYNVDDPGNPGDPDDQNYSSTDEVVAADGTDLYFADTGSSTVALIDSSQLWPSNESPSETLVNVGLFPQGLAVSPDGSEVWVADTGPQTAEENSSQISVIEASTESVVATIPLQGKVQQIAFSPDGTTAYATSSDGLDVISVANRNVETRVGGLGATRGVAVSPDGRYVYVTDVSSNSVSVVRTADDTVVATVPVGQLPWAVALAPGGARAYVANSDSNSVSVIDTATDRVLSTITLNGDPDALALTPDGSELWVGEAASGSLAVIQTSTGDVLGDVDLGTAYEPTSLAITS